MSKEKKYTKEEIRSFVDDTIQNAKSGKKIELTPEELEQAAGGRRVLKHNHFPCYTYARTEDIL
jgi:hypothetical protein